MASLHIFGEDEPQSHSFACSCSFALVWEGGLANSGHCARHWAGELFLIPAFRYSRADGSQVILVRVMMTNMEGWNGGISGPGKWSHYWEESEIGAGVMMMMMLRHSSTQAK